MRFILAEGDMLYLAEKMGISHVECFSETGGCSIWQKKGMFGSF